MSGAAGLKPCAQGPGRIWILSTVVGRGTISSQCQNTYCNFKMVHARIKKLFYRHISQRVTAVR